MEYKFEFSSNRLDYEIEDLIGTGRIAKVYKATYKKRIPVAIKEIDKDFITRLGLFSKLAQEISTLASLKHPSIIQLYTYFEDGGLIYIVLELCVYGKLEDYIKIKNLDEDEVRYIMKQAVEGIRYLHSKNIVYGDLSLSNILVTKGMTIKIADFGSSKHIWNDPFQPKSMWGSFDFISPEIVTNESAGYETDIWSLGCLLYTLLVGTPPFETLNMQKTFKRIEVGEYYMPKNLSPEAKDLIRRMLRKDPQERISLNDVLSHPFFQKLFVMKTPFSSMNKGLSQDDVFSVDRIVHTTERIIINKMPNNPLNFMANGVNSPRSGEYSSIGVNYPTCSNHDICKYENPIDRMCNGLTPLKTYYSKNDIFPALPAPLHERYLKEKRPRTKHTLHNITQENQNLEKTKSKHNGSRIFPNIHMAPSISHYTEEFVPKLAPRQSSNLCKSSNEEGCSMVHKRHII